MDFEVVGNGYSEIISLLNYLISVGRNLTFWISENRIINEINEFLKIMKIFL